MARETDNFIPVEDSKVSANKTSTARLVRYVYYRFCITLVYFLADFFIVAMIVYNIYM